jgi:hypothetical protein
MRTSLRFAPVLATFAAIALGATTSALAQDTSSARTDTSAYSADTSASRGASQSTGVQSDTALKAKPGLQTGPAAKDSGMAGRTGGKSDMVVCKDGSNAPRKGNGCRKHGGVDSVATKAALKARGETMAPKDSTSSR